MNQKTLVFIPTYNEAENIESIYREIKGLNLDVDFLFVDDNSPDGTGQIIDRLVREDTKVHVIHRPERNGIGTAHLEGIRWAYQRSYQNLITMDADFSHSPKYLPDFLRQAHQSNVVVGSRYLPHSRFEGWHWIRKILTYLGHFLTRIILRMPYDATNAYRLYRLDKIPEGIFKIVNSKGYSFFFESLYVIQLNGHTIQEIPIALLNRRYGHSKMRFKDFFDSITQLARSYIRSLINRDAFLYSQSSVHDAEAFVSKD